MGSREDEVYADELRSVVASTTGGVMTEEVGAVTGDLEVATRPLEAEGIEVTVRRGRGVVHRRRGSDRIG